MIVTSPSGRQTTALAPLRDVSPALFTLDGSGTGEAAALDAVTFATGPFHAGSDVALFGTGIRNARQVSVKVGGSQVDVTGFAAHSGFEGLDQVNIHIPRDFTLQGSLEIELNADGQTTGSSVRLTLE